MAEVEKVTVSARRTATTYAEARNHLEQRYGRLMAVIKLAEGPGALDTIASPWAGRLKAKHRKLLSTALGLTPNQVVQARRGSIIRILLSSDALRVLALWCPGDVLLVADQGDRFVDFSQGHLQPNFGVITNAT